jgi:branched-chain amino acid transport system substrate-binding protein
MRAKTRRAVVGALSGVLAIVGAACSSSGSTAKSSAETTPTTTANLALLGPGKAATGAPLKIGFIYAGQTEAIDDRPELATAQAAVKYVNEHLGGVAGRPLELLSCTDNLLPANAIDCANQMIAAKVPVVLQSQPTNPAPVMKLLAAAKIPYFSWEGVDQSILLSPYGWAIGNPLTVLGGPIKFAKDNDLKKVAMVYIDIPATASFRAIADPIYKKSGIALVATGIPPGTPDVAPQVQAALSKGAQEFVVVGDSTLCINTLKALKTLGFTGQTMINSQCVGGLAQAVPGGIKGVVVATIASNDPRDPEVALYDAVVAKYAPGTQAHGVNAEPGYAVVIAFARGVKDLDTSDVTPARIMQALTSMSPQTLPLLSGQTFQCNRKLAALTPAVCSNGAALETLDASGNVTRIEKFDLAPYLSLG